MVKVKVCGLTDKNNVREVVETGVNAIGFILAESPRQVSLKKVKSLTRGLPPFLNTVGVVVNPHPEKLQEINNSGLFDYIQFHGSEDRKLIKTSQQTNIKAISIAVENDLQLVEKYHFVDYYLFDTRIKNKNGGTGRTFNWNLLDNINLKKPFILAGGLGPENIIKAITSVRPEAVDLNSKIEKKPGIKDIHLLQTTLQKISSIDNNYRT